MNWKIISKKLSVFCIPCLMVMMTLSLNAQMTSNGNMYIPSKGFISVFNDINFENGGYGIQPGIISTNRNSNPGVVNFVDASWTNANDFQHVDGYVRILSDEAFTFPVGNLGFFRPISISGGKGTRVAYYLDNPNNISPVEIRTAGDETSPDKLVRISSDEYWHITGTQETQLTLTWDINSDISSLTQSDLKKLQIVGFDGTDWVIIPSHVNYELIDMKNSKADFANIESTLEAGSISTAERIVPNDYSFITFGIAGEENIDTDSPFDSEVLGSDKIEMTVFPNPTFDLNNLKVDYNLYNTDSDAYIVVYAADGQLVFREKLIENNTIYNMNYSENTDGMYQVGIVTDSGSRVFKLVVIGSK